MIITRLEGGLGNQLFQYAAGRSLAARVGAELFVDTLALDKAHKKATKRKYELDKFRVACTHLDQRKLNGLRCIHAAPKLGCLLNKINLYREKDLQFNRDFLQLRDQTYLWGYWQSPLYFEPIARDLFEEFQPIAPLSIKSLLIKKQLTDAGQASIAIHIRRGDYATLKSAANFHGTLDLSYYTNAIGHAESCINNPTFFIFSDDIDWCIKNLPIPKPRSIFVSHNVGDAAYQDMVLMAFCRHHIIANSSFSWWGAWLADQRWQGQARLVVAPKRWFRGETARSFTESLIPKNWLRI